MATKEVQDHIAQGLAAGRISGGDAAAVLAGAKPMVRLSGRFPAGTKVELRRRSGIRFSENEPIIGRARTTGEDSTVEFDSDVRVGDRYWVVGRPHDGEVLAVAVTGKVPPVEKERTERPDADAARPHQRTAPVWIEERRKAQDAQKLSEVPPTAVGIPQSAMPGGVPQASATPLGEGTPTAGPGVPQEPADRPVPLAQADTNGVPQASDTSRGEAAVVLDARERIDAALAADPDGEVHEGVKREHLDGVTSVPPAKAPGGKTSAGKVRLTGAQLKQRAKELDIPGRGSMKAAQLRRAVTLAEKKQG